MKKRNILIITICLGVLILCAVVVGIKYGSMFHRKNQLNVVIQDNVPFLDGGCSNIAPANKVTQSFKPRLHALSGIGIGINTLNQGKGGDTITLKLNRQGKTLAEVSQFTPEGFDGFLLFNMSKPIDVVPVEVLDITVSDTGKIIFCWKRGADSYKDGTGTFYGREAGGDFFFLTYGSL